MKITKYEIDMLDVKSADAFLIHFYDDDDNDKDYIILVDAGNYNNGPTIANFIKNRYGKKNIDLAICSHCDKDHFGGFVWLLEQIRDNAPNRINISQSDGRGGKRCSYQSAGMDAVPKHFIQTVQIHFSRTAFNLCTATGSNCRSIHGNLESEDVPLDQKGIQGDCLD